MAKPEHLLASSSALLRGLTEEDKPETSTYNYMKSYFNTK